MVINKKLHIVTVWLIIFTLLAMFISSTNDAKAERKTVDNYEISIDGDTVEITKYIGNETDIKIPKKLDGKTVTSIGRLAFSNTNNPLTSVTIPDSVTSIGESAFKYSQLKSIEIPDSVTEIAIHAFRNTPHLEHVVLPKHLKTIEGETFSYTALKSVTIPDSVTKIGPGAFSHSMLESVEIPDSVKTIEWMAFMDNNLIEVTIPNSVTDIDRMSFSQNNLTTVTIGNNVINIGNSAFSDNQLINVEIPNSVIEIGDSAFLYNSLKTVIIENKDTTVGSGAFNLNQSNSGDLTIFGHDPSPAKDYATTNGHKFSRIDSFSLNDNDDGTATITDYQGTRKNIVIPGTLAGLRITGIGDGAFENKNLTGVTFPDSIKSIDKNAFSGNQLKNITIPESVTRIGNDVFRDNKLTRVDIPSGVTSIGDGAFKNNNLKRVLVLNNNVSFGDRVFDHNQDNSADLILHGYESSTTKIYAKKMNHIFKDLSDDKDYEWSDNGDGTATLTNYNGEDKSLDIPDLVGRLLVTKIGAHAFSQKGLTSAIIPGSVTEIEKNAFYDNNLSSIDIPDSVRTIGTQAFYSNKLSSVDIPNGVGTIMDSAFYKNNLSSVVIPSSVTFIGHVAFNQNQITRVEIRNKDTDISGDPFSVPSSLESLNQILTIYGYDPSTAKNYEEGIRKGERYRNTITFSTDNSSLAFSENGNLVWAPSHSTKVDVSGYDEKKPLQYTWTTSTSMPTSGWSTLSKGETLETPTKTDEYYLHVSGTSTFGSAFNHRSNVFKVDNTNPTIPTIHAPTTWQNSDVAVSITEGSDDHSDVDKTEYRLNGGSWKTYNNSFIIEDNGETKIEARTIDKAGNVGSKATETVKLDKTNPKLSLRADNTSPTNKDVTITATGTDNDSGVKQIKDPHGTWHSKSEIEFTVSSNGTYKFEVEDNAENITTKTIEIDNIDKIKPNISLSENGGGYARNHSTKIIASDKSGIEKIQYAWTTNSNFPSSGLEVVNNNEEINVPTTTGKYYLHVKAIDKAGNKNEFTSKVFKIDVKNPNLVLTIDNELPTNSYVKITATGSDDDSGFKQIREKEGTWINTISMSKTVTENGIYVFEVEDNVGNKTIKSIEINNIDKTNPSEPTIDAPTTWKNDNVTVSITDGTDDHSGVDKTEYRLNGGNWKTYNNSFIIEDNGETKIEARTIDKAGNISPTAVKTAKLDKTNPSLTLSIDIDSPTNKDVTITATGTDNHSGVKRIKDIDGKWHSKSEIEFTVSSNGTYKFEVEDNAENITTKTIEIDNIDTIKPIISLSKNGGDYAKSHSTEIIATDNESGIEKIQYVWTTNSNFPSSGLGEVNNNEKINVPTTTGYHYLHVKAKDKAGNKKEFTSNVFKIDLTKPNLTLTKDDTLPTNADVTITATGSDDDSGVKRIKYANGTWHSKSEIEFTFSSNGTYTFEIEDNVGNNFSKSIEINNIDKVAPGKPSISAPTSWQRDNVSVSITDGEDNESGVDYTQYRLNKGTWKTYNKSFIIKDSGETKIEARSIDRAGNVSPTVSKIVKLDKVVPNFLLSANKTSPTNKDIIITAIGTDSHSGVKRIKDNNGKWHNKTEIKFTVNKNGKYTFVVEDNAGNETEQSITIDNIDKTAPTVSLSKDSGDYALSHSTKITATDNESGIEKVEYAWTTDLSFPTSNFKEIKNYKSISTPNSTGNYFLHVRATDKVGNSKNLTSGEFRIDNNKPSIEILPSQKTWSNEISPKVIVIDNESGVDASNLHYIWSKGTDKPEDKNQDWVNFINGEKITLDKDGKWYLHIRASDKAGNVVYIHSRVFQRDTMAPSKPMIILSEITGKNDWYNKLPNFTIKLGKDEGAGSGVSHVLYRVNGGKWKTYNDPVNIRETGLMVIEAKTVDRAGNASEVSKSTLKIDTEGPIIRLSENGNDSTAESVSTKVTILDNMSGVNLKSLKYMWSANMKKPPTNDNHWVKFNNNEMLNLTNVEGGRYLHILAEDRAGNESYFVSSRFQLGMKGSQTFQETNHHVRENRGKRTETILNEAKGRTINHVNVDKKTVDEAIKDALKSGNNQVRIILGNISAEHADEVTVDIPVNVLEILKKSGKDLSIEVGNVTISLPKKTLQEMNGSKSSLFFRIIPIHDERERKEIISRISTSEELQQYVKGSKVRIVGEAMTIETNYQNHRTIVQFPLDNIDFPTDTTEREVFLEKLAVYIEHSDGENVVEKGTIIYDDEGNPKMLEIEIDKFSTFTLITTESDLEEMDQDPSEVNPKDKSNKETMKEAKSTKEQTSNIIPTSIMWLIVSLLLLGVMVVYFNYKRQKRH